MRWRFCVKAALGALALGAMPEACPASPAGEAAKPPPGGVPVLDEGSYCRAYHQFGWEYIDPKALKEQGERLFGKRGLQRLERSVKQRLRGRGIDWSKTDWRERAAHRRCRWPSPWVDGYRQTG